MHIDVLVAEIGSTITAVNAFTGLGTDKPRFLGQGSAATTAGQGDVTWGLERAVEDLTRRIASGGKLTWEHMLAASSAAGGLRMTVHGLVHEMTARAAEEAALGAGAIVRMVTAGELDDDALNRVEEADPGIILLAGGVDYGEERTVLANARKLAGAARQVPVIFAGNRAVAEKVREIFRDRGRPITVVDNVYPQVDDLNVKPARRAIQGVFEQHITLAPGMERIRKLVKGSIMPTPGAVMAALEVFYRYRGDAMAVDVGGATTDVHSVTEGSPSISELMMAPEPVAKRTVEGDLGVFGNARHLLKRLGKDRIEREVGFDPQSVLDDWGPWPRRKEDWVLLERLTAGAVEVAVHRHAGRLRYLYGPQGRKLMAEGKDLTAVRWIIGTGGPLTQLEVGRSILENVRCAEQSDHLYPRKEARVLIDRHYIMAATGVLADCWPDDAHRLLERSLEVDDPFGAA